jgi:hypothetical protein
MSEFGEFKEPFEFYEPKESDAHELKDSFDFHELKDSFDSHELKDSFDSHELYLDEDLFIPEFDCGYMKLYCFEEDFEINDNVRITKLSNEEIIAQKNLSKYYLFKGWLMSDIFTYLFKETLGSQDSQICL